MEVFGWYNLYGSHGCARGGIVSLLAFVVVSLEGSSRSPKILARISVDDSADAGMLGLWWMWMGVSAG